MYNLVVLVYSQSWFNEIKSEHFQDTDLIFDRIKFTRR